jgi:hypothetical protein
LPNFQNPSISSLGKHEEFSLQISRGHIANHSSVNLFGTSDAIGLIFTTPWENAGVNGIPLLEVASPLNIFSANNLDTSNVTFIIKGVDSNWNKIQDIVTSAGDAGVATTNSYLRINEFITIAGNASGDVYANVASVTYSQINQGFGKSQAAIYSVPANHSLHIYNIDVFSATTTGPTKYLTYRNRVLNEVTGTVLNIAQTTFHETISISRFVPFRVAEKNTIQLQCKSSSGTNSVGLFVETVLVEN